MRYALLMPAPGYLWAGWHAWQAGKTVARDLVELPVYHEDIGGAPRGVRIDPHFRAREQQAN